MSSYYTAAIDCLEEATPQMCRKILVRIAKVQPSAVVKAHDAVSAKVVDVLLIAYGNNPIKVIKAIRNHTNMSLKAAKDIVDSAPAKVIGNISVAQAKIIADDLSEAGAVVRISTE